MQDKNYFLPFSVFPGIGPTYFSLLYAYFGSARATWEASVAELRNAHLSEVITEKFDTFRKAFSIESYVKQLKKANVWFITTEEEEYPALLKAIPHPPFVLYGKGDQKLVSQKQTVGVVGTRKVTQYGQQVTEQFSQALSRAGCVVVSGLALGVDAIAHQRTLAEGGKTIAVLGCGVDVCYPSSNERLYQQIIEKNGAVVSEYPLQMSPSVGSFPSRNRIIAGLSEVLLVTEGAEDSGALITARDALAIGRQVFAIPGPITSNLSKGTNLLINQGAKPALTPDAVLKELGLKNLVSQNTQKLQGNTEEEQTVIDLLAEENMSLDDLVRKTKYTVAQVSLILSQLELAGIVKDLRGTYSLNN